MLSGIGYAIVSLLALVSAEPVRSPSAACTPIPLSNTPSNATCDRIGVLKNAKDVSLQFVSSTDGGGFGSPLGQCVSQCQVENSIDRALSFQFDNSTRHCKCYKKTVDKQGFQPRTPADGGILTSDLSCWTCTFTNPDNMINAGDFEDNSWGNWTFGRFSSGQQVVMSPGFASEYAGAHALPAVAGFTVYSVYNKTLIPTVPGRIYSWSYHYMIVNHFCATSFENLEGTLGNYDNTLLTPNIWYGLQSNFLATRHFEQLELLSYCKNAPSPPQGIVTAFDNLQLLPASDTIYNISMPPTGPNIIANSNFDSGKIKPFFFDGFVKNKTIISPGPNGAKYALAVTSYANNPLNIDQILTTEPGQVYAVVAQFKLAKAFFEPANKCQLSALFTSYTKEITYGPRYQQAGPIYPSATQDKLPYKNGYYQLGTPLLASANTTTFSVRIFCEQATLETIIGNITVSPIS